MIYHQRRGRGGIRRNRGAPVRSGIFPSFSTAGADITLPDHRTLTERSCNNAVKFTNIRNSIPKTGDNHTPLWIGLLMDFALGMSTCVILINRKQYRGSYVKKY